MSEMFEGIEAVVDDLLIWGECKAALQLPDADSRQSNTVKSIAEQAQVPNKKTKSATLVTFLLKILNQILRKRSHINIPPLKDSNNS